MSLREVLRDLWPEGGWPVVALTLVTVVLLAWAYTSTQDDDPAVTVAPCSGLEGADLDACLDARFADDFSEDPREPFGGGVP